MNRLLRLELVVVLVVLFLSGLAVPNGSRA
ncbi:MAG: hypothetical protein QOF73_4251, partial [Thermomicrobiales bacterium]|nr:hypothetical protein [Thermomicrobiales bacterium]